MNREPLVSIIVLNYKRLQELKRCLDSIIRQDYPNVEVIVVDNHSEEDVAAVVHSAGHGIRLIELTANLGPCSGRNAGIRAASGEFLITLDNDVSFASSHEVSEVVSAFQEHSQIHVLAFRICDIGTGELRVREWCHPRDWRQFADTEFETSFFGEGASAYRREIFAVTGLYWEPLFIGHEGYELALRLFDHGFRILYFPRVSVFHSMSSETRPTDRPYYFYTRNYIWIAYKDHRLLPAIRFLVPKLLMMLAFSLRAGRLVPFLRGAWDGVRGIPAIRPRTPLCADGIGYLATVTRMRPNVFTRLARHWSGTRL